jgi:hypothetical protein
MLHNNNNNNNNSNNSNNSKVGHGGARRGKALGGLIFTKNSLISTNGLKKTMNNKMNNNKSDAKNIYPSSSTSWRVKKIFFIKESIATNLITTGRMCSLK